LGLLAIAIELRAVLGAVGFMGAAILCFAACAADFFLGRVWIKAAIWALLT
jgi:hypothetical protein